MPPVSHHLRPLPWGPNLHPLSSLTTVTMGLWIPVLVTVARVGFIEHKPASCSLTYSYYPWIKIQILQLWPVMILLIFCIFQSFILGSIFSSSCMFVVSYIHRLFSSEVSTALELCGSSVRYLFKCFIILFPVPLTNFVFFMNLLIPNIIFCSLYLLVLIQWKIELRTYSVLSD